MKNRRGILLERGERVRLEAAIEDVRTLHPRMTLVRAGEPLHQSLFLIEGIMSRHMDDGNGRRQLVAVHLPGDFVDLHGYPLKRLDHDVGTMTAATVAVVPHSAFDAIVADMPVMARKLWFATMLDAAMHRAWLFRLGRLDGPCALFGHGFTVAGSRAAA